MNEVQIDPGATSVHISNAESSVFNNSVVLQSGHILDIGDRISLSKFENDDKIIDSVTGQLETGDFSEKDREKLISETLTEQSVKCQSCGSPILTSDGISVNDKCFHRECVKCGFCSGSFQPNDTLFMGLNDKLMCSNCKITNSDKLKTQSVCFYCKKVIKDHAMKALDKIWHTECFVCNDCSVVLTGYFRDTDNIPYCEKCWLKNFAKTCRICSDYISEQVMTIENHHYHTDCVKCAVCKQTFDNVLDILNIDLEFWHVGCFKEDESDSESASSALLGVYDKSLVVSTPQSSTTLSPIPNKILTVSFKTQQSACNDPPPSAGSDSSSVPDNTDISSTKFRNDTDILVKQDNISKPAVTKSTCCTIS